MDACPRMPPCRPVPIIEIQRTEAVEAIVQQGRERRAEACTCEPRGACPETVELIGRQKRRIGRG